MAARSDRSQSGRFCSRRRRQVLLGLTGGLCAACVLFAHLAHRERQAQELEKAFLQIRKGLSGSDVNAIVGSLPDRSARVNGVPAYGSTFLTADNEQARRHGTPTVHELRSWKRGPVTGLVIIDDAGRVVSRSLTGRLRRNRLIAGFARVQRLLRGLWK